LILEFGGPQHNGQGQQNGYHAQENHPAVLLNDPEMFFELEFFKIHGTISLLRATSVTEPFDKLG
jgi:hypothetical protein